MQRVDDSRYFDVYKDSRTGVRYLVYERSSGYGIGTSICVMVDAEGKPLVDKE
jgi:hypothetical protein